MSVDDKTNKSHIEDTHFLTKSETTLLVSNLIRKLQNLHNFEIKSNLWDKYLTNIVISYSVINEWWDPNKKGHGIELEPNNIVTQSMSGYKCVFSKN